MYEFNYQQRIKRLQAALLTEGVDYAVILQTGNIKYLTGFWGYATRAEYFEPARLLCLVVPRNGTPLLVVPKIERDFAEAATRRLSLDIKHHVEWPSTSDPMDAWGLVRTFVDQGGVPNPRLSIEKSHLTEKAYTSFADKFDGYRIVESSGIVERHREVKDEVELRLFEACGELAAGMFRVELDAIKQGGYREYEVAMAGWHHNVRACADFLESSTHNDEYANSPIGFSAQLLTSGPRISRPHGTASTRMIRPADLVAIDLCRVPYLLGYRTGLGRVVSQRPLTSREQDINATVKSAYDVGVSMCRPGTVVADIDTAVRSILEDGGLGPYIMHRTGRTIGCEPGPEIPIAKGVQRKLEAGMVLSLEPSVYMDDYQSRIESTFAVTNDGAHLLTRVPEQMIVI